MYKGIKYISEDEFQRLKAEDEFKTFHKKYNYASRSPKNYYSGSRKAIQRTLNYYVRTVNKVLADDYLWRGRFFIKQVEYAPYKRFEDGSGGELFVTLRIYDKKTEKYVDICDSAGSLCFCDGAKIARFANDAIVKVFEVWPKDKEGKESPYNDRILYLSIPETYVIKNAVPAREFNYIDV